MINHHIILTTRQKSTGEIESLFREPMTCPTRLPKTGSSKMYSKVELQFIEIFGNIRNAKVDKSDLLKNNNMSGTRAQGMSRSAKVLEK